MKTFTQTTGRGLSGYHSPELQSVEVRIEQGFAGSLIQAASSYDAGGVKDSGVDFGNEATD